MKLIIYSIICGFLAIFNLSQKNIILEDEDEFKKKILLLKHLYKQI